MKAIFKNHPLEDHKFQNADDRRDPTGISTGLHDLDQVLDGLQCGELIVLAALHGMGKTTIAINIAEHVAINDRLPVAIFSMAVGGKELAKRLLS